jgi:hypothetical protein
MKKIFTILAAFVALSSFTIITGLNDVVNAIKSGNAASVSKYFDNTVEITVNGKSSNYSKTQGEVVLRDFFANNAVKSFTVLHQGQSGGAEFCIGTLVTSNGNFRTTLNLKQKGDKQTLQEIKFEK